MSERFISQEDAATIASMMGETSGTAHVLLLVGKNCRFCKETRQLMEELHEISPEHIALRVVDVDEDPEGASLAEQYGVEGKTPAIIYLDADGNDTGMRYFGIPSGYEFGALIEDLVDVANGRSQLSAASLEKVRAHDEELVIRVFVTPT